MTGMARALQVEVMSCDTLFWKWFNRADEVNPMRLATRLAQRSPIASLACLNPSSVRRQERVASRRRIH